MNIELTKLEKENLAGWLNWFITEGGTNVLFPDAIDLLDSVLRKLAD
jgi:hypothetical protein